MLDNDQVVITVFQVMSTTFTWRTVNHRPLDHFDMKTIPLQRGVSRSDQSNERVWYGEEDECTNVTCYNVWVGYGGVGSREVIQRVQTFQRSPSQSVNAIHLTHLSRVNSLSVILSIIRSLILSFLSLSILLFERTYEHPPSLYLCVHLEVRPVQRLFDVEIIEVDDCDGDNDRFIKNQLLRKDGIQNSQTTTATTTSKAYI